MPSAEEKCGDAFTIEPLATGLIYNAKKIGPQTWRHLTPNQILDGQNRLAIRLGHRTDRMPTFMVMEQTAGHFPPQQQSNNAWQSMRCWIRSRLIRRPLR